MRTVTAPPTTWWPIPFQAIGLNCPGGTAENSIQVNNATMNAADPNSWKIITGFGTQAGSHYGDLLWAANQNPWDESGRRGDRRQHLERRA